MNTKRNILIIWHVSTSLGSEIVTFLPDKVSKTDCQYQNVTLLLVSLKIDDGR